MASEKYVSRGGDKLEAALEQWVVKVGGLICLDIGSSTGGFVDCLLKHGAKKVYSVDTAYGELAWVLRNDPKVVVMERTNVLHLEALPEPVDLITIDTGWTKLELVLLEVRRFLKEDGKILALLKPQYEADQRDLRRGILPPDKAELVKDQVLERIELGFKIYEQMESPILGGAGNREYLILLK